MLFLYLVKHSDTYYYALIASRLVHFDIDIAKKLSIELADVHDNSYSFLKNLLSLQKIKW